MSHRRRCLPLGRCGLPLVVLAILMSACSGGPVASSPTADPLPAATSFDGYALAFCASWESLFRAVGNPDTAEGSVLSRSLDAAVSAKDGSAAARLAGDITVELETGRRSVASGGAWSPATPMMSQLDRLFLAYEAMIAAKAAMAAGQPGAVDPQTAFEGAGGLTAWKAMFEAYPALDPERPANVAPCGNLPIAP